MPGCLSFSFDPSPYFIIDQPPILVTCNRVMHSISIYSRLLRWVLKIYFAEILNLSPHTILGIIMSNHVYHQFSCCYLEYMDFRAPNCKSTKLAMAGRIQILSDNRVSLLGVLTVLLQCLHVVPFIIHSESRHSRRSLKNLPYPENALFALFLLY